MRPLVMASAVNFIIRAARGLSSVKRFASVGCPLAHKQRIHERARRTLCQERRRGLNLSSRRASAKYSTSRIASLQAEVLDRVPFDQQPPRGRAIKLCTCFIFRLTVVMHRAQIASPPEQMKTQTLALSLAFIAATHFPLQTSLAAILVAWNSSPDRGLTPGLPVVTPQISSISGIWTRGTGMSATPFGNGTAVFLRPASISTSLNANDYFQFSVAPNVAYFHLDYLNLNTRVASSTTNWTVRSSLDNFTTDIGTAFSGSTGKQTAVTLGDAFNNLYSTVTFRIYPWNSGGAGAVAGLSGSRYVLDWNDRFRIRFGPFRHRRWPESSTQRMAARGTARPGPRLDEHQRHPKCLF